jgi:two-component system NtrC family sensor kinase
VAGLGLLTLRLTVESGELHRVDERLKLLAAAVEQTGDLILITTGKGRIVHANLASIRALGYPRERLYALSLAEVLDDSQRELVDAIGAHVRAHGVWRGTLQHRRADGRTFPASSTVVALRDAHQQVTHFVGVQRDITEELRLRDQLVHSERMSAVGELVAGVAHEINNPLQTIVGCVELLLEETRDEQQLEDLRLVRQEASRAGQIVRNLLAFVRRGSPDRAAIDLNDVVRATAALRAFLLGQRDVRLLLDLAPGPLPVLANRDELLQIIVNLVLNAEHAIEKAGVRDGTITLRTRTEDGVHVLRVMDNGPGISRDLKGRVFEPFFTTKEVGEGTGLGLSISLGIARAHGGALELCEPVEGSGACFRLSLPVHAGTAAAAPPAAAPLHEAAPAGDRTPRALVIDDEPPVRHLLVRLLERRGYAVSEAASRAEAAAALAEASFDVILCDVRLPDGNGAAVVRDIREVDPPLARRVVFVTGDAGALEAHAADVEGVPVLAKPFTSADLDRALDALPAGQGATA